jgi:hypothetical protein
MVAGTSPSLKTGLLFSRGSCYRLVSIQQEIIMKRITAVAAGLLIVEFTLFGCASQPCGPARLRCSATPEPANFAR